MIAGLVVRVGCANYRLLMVVVIWFSVCFVVFWCVCVWWFCWLAGLCSVGFL